MESDKNVDGSVSGGLASSRWNPTKEQISILEAMYKEGIRTPSAEQIQHITSRLKTYGHIEGKNVFYWFQNHKARQRQKQKQDSMVYLNQFYHNSTTAPAFNPSPCTNNVVCSPYYIPQNYATISYYPQYPKVPIPSVARRKQRTENNIETGVGGAAYHQPYGIMHTTGDSNEETINKHHTITSPTSNETLALFPLHPGGILNEHSTDSFISSSADNSNSSDRSGVEEGCGDQHFIDFFGQRGSWDFD